PQIGNAVINLFILRIFTARKDHKKWQSTFTNIKTGRISLGKVVYKAEFWKHHEQTPLNERQRLVLNKLLDGFDGKLKSSKWAEITKSSSDTALRDIKDLMEKGI